MLESSFTFTDAVRAVRIAHHLERFSVFHQFIDEHFGVLVMHIVITCAMTSRPDRALVLLAKLPGKLISKYPKNEIANTIKITKKKRFNQTLVEKLLST